MAKTEHVTPVPAAGRILVVDDDPYGRELLSAILSAHGYDLVVLPDADDALAHVADVDLVLLDAVLPGRDGWSLCQEIKQKVDPLLPVIMVTARTDPQDIVRTFESGADDYIAKPFQHLELLARVRSRLRTREAEDRLRDTLDHLEQLYHISQEAQRRYRFMFDNNPQPMWVFDIESLRFLDVNESAVVHYGYPREEFLRLTMHQVWRGLNDEEIEAVYKQVHDPGTISLQVQHVTRGGDIITVEVTSRRILYEGKPARFSLINDVTERERSQAALKASEEQLRQAQKMEAVGRLAGGIAHDFNNLLTAIHGNAQLLLDELPADPRLQADVQEIIRATDRATSLTRQLLAFSRRQVLQPRVIDVNAILADMERMLSRLIGEHIQLETQLAPDLPTIKADPGQFEQVILNLVVNARDAMPAGGTLTIETGPVEIGNDTHFAEPGLRPGPHARIRVTDTGTGMQPDVLARIFEPFYTTKEQGKGTGLGLSTAYGIVQQTGGQLQVESAPGAGTSFTILIPAAQEPVESSAAAKVAVSRGSETILLVEDEAAVRRLARRVLERAGYRVIEAETGSAALEWARSNTDPIDLLLTDVVMPEIGGRALAQGIIGSRPNVRLLYMSGYTEDEAVHTGVIQDGIPFLEKPFTPVALIRKVRETLDSPRPSMI